MAVSSGLEWAATRPASRRNRRPALAGLAQLSSSKVLLGSHSLKCIGFDFRGTTAYITATLAAFVASLADSDDDACESPVARAATGRA